MRTLDEAIEIIANWPEERLASRGYFGAPERWMCPAMALAVTWGWRWRGDVAGPTRFVAEQLGLDDAEIVWQRIVRPYDAVGEAPQYWLGSPWTPELGRQQVLASLREWKKETVA